jgi:predicted MPP superfamily phosphohydrolase
VFLLIPLAIWSAMNAYVAWRIGGVPLVRNHVPRWVIVVAAVFLALSYLAARIVESRSGSWIGVALEWVGAQWMGVLLIALACFFLADVATGFGWLFRPWVPRIRTVALFAAALLSLVAAVNALRPPVVRDHEIAIENLPQALDGTVLVAISDLHIGRLVSDRWIAALVKQVASLDPDLIAIAGDIAEGDAPPERETSRLQGLRAPLGVWAVPGNHDHPRSDPLLEAEHIRVLRDRWAQAAPGLVIAGLDTTGHRRVPGRGEVEKALAGRPGGATILLSHYPQQVEKAARGGVGLMLAGHTHAGQIWPFGMFVRMAYRWTGGRYEVEGMPLIVSRGTGTWGPAMRLWRPNEILRIVLRRETR